MENPLSRPSACGGFSHPQPMAKKLIVRGALAPESAAPATAQASPAGSATRFMSRYARDDHAQ
jgi:hypothetical protein